MLPNYIKVNVSEDTIWNVKSWLNCYYGNDQDWTCWSLGGGYTACIFLRAGLESRLAPNSGWHTIWFSLFSSDDFTQSKHTQACLSFVRLNKHGNIQILPGHTMKSKLFSAPISLGYLLMGTPDSLPGIKLWYQFLRCALKLFYRHTKALCKFRIFF